MLSDSFNVCRDVLQFADADEAEAVYSMVSLTQAAAPGWLPQNPVAKVGWGVFCKATMCA
jgi:hypothetical protein